MIPHSLFYQPRNTGSSWGDPDATPVAPPTDPAAPTSAPAAPATTTTPAAPSNNSYLSQEQCESASKNGLIAAGGYAFGSSLLGIMIFMIMRKKLWGTAFSRYLTAVLTAAILSSVLVGWDPVRADILERCLDPNQGFTQYVFLGSMIVARALVLGLVPSVLLTLTGCFVANRT